MDLTQGFLFDESEAANPEPGQEAEWSLDDALDHDAPEVNPDAGNEAEWESSPGTGQESDGEHADAPGVAEQNETGDARWTWRLIDLSPYPPISRLAQAYPDLLPHEFAAMVEDILSRGQQNPIAVWRGQIVDGKHRFFACLAAGVIPVFNRLPADVNPFEHVRGANDLRRHSSANERAETAFALWTLAREGFPYLPEDQAGHFANLQNAWHVPTLEEVAGEAGVSPRLVSHVASVRGENSTATPELRAAAEGRLVRYSDASGIVGESPEVQRRAVDLVQSGHAKTVRTGAKLAKQVMAGDTAAIEAGTEHPRRVGEAATLYRSSVASLGARLDPGSVQIIIAVPPEEVSLSYYSDLIVLSARVLNDEGVLAMPVYPERLPETVARLVHPDLQWIWEFDLMFESPVEIHIDPHVIRTRRIPLLVYGKSRSSLTEGFDVIEVPSPEPHLTDRRRILEQGMAAVMNRFATPGSVVCLPRCQGMGPAAQAALDVGCVVIGADEDQACLDQLAEQLEDYIRRLY